MGLGSIADVSLAEARETARGYRKLAKQGIGMLGVPHVTGSDACQYSEL